MTTKTLTTIAAVILGLAVLVFGKDALSYLSGALAYTRNTVKETIPSGLEISRLKLMLGKLDAVIERRRAALVDMQLQSERLDSEIMSRRQRLAVDRAALEKAAALLEEEQDSYVIGGVTYSHAEVDADARIKADRFRQDRELLAARETTLGHFTEAVNDARRILSDAEVARQSLANQVQNLEIRAERLNSQTRVEAGKDHTGRESLGKAYAGIHRGIADLERRLTKGERLFDMRKTGVDGIDYASNSNQVSGLEALREALQ